jgi:large subunit ribosomal protein L18
MHKIGLKTGKERRRKRTGVFGTEDKPRLSVFRSNKYIYAQIINDREGITLVTIDDETKGAHEGKSKSEAAFELGKSLAERALDKNIETVVFDKGPYKYHGRVRKFAEGAREGGLKF